MKEIDQTLYVGIYLLWSGRPFASSFCNIRDKNIMHASQERNPSDMGSNKAFNTSHKLKQEHKTRFNNFEGFKGST